MDFLTLALAKKGGGVSSWNDLTDKPFSEEQAFEPIAFVGEFKKLPSVDFGALLGTGGLIGYRICDTANPATIYEGSSVSFGVRATILENNPTELSEPEGLRIYYASFSDTEGAVTCGFVFAAVDDTFTIAEIPAGLYMAVLLPGNATGLNDVLTISKESIKTLDEKYLPAPIVPMKNLSGLQLNIGGSASMDFCSQYGSEQIEEILASHEQEFEIVIGDNVEPSIFRLRFVKQTDNTWSAGGVYAYNGEPYILYAVVHIHNNTVSIYTKSLMTS